MIHYNRHLFLMLLLIAISIQMGQAQNRNKAYEDYIKKYRELAVKEMKHHHIPASITLAQGLLESGAGKSELARKSNNHFGIKCGRGWKGATVSHDDDARGECFRKYKSVKDSYEDHSKFLTSGARYASLFKLKLTNYKGWAKGLKKAGYATDPKYADRLIKIIELYNLSQYDRKGSLKKNETYKEIRQTYLSNGLLYVIANKFDTFLSLSEELDINPKKIRKWNELPEDYIFEGGEVIYLQEKLDYATEGYDSHVVKAGESLYSISQTYGIWLKCLFNLNKINGDVSIAEGDTIKLR